MKLIKDLKEIDGLGKINIGLTIGNFDGVHLGHRHLLQHVKEICLKKNLKFVVMTFIPHPHQILSPKFQHYLINSYEERRVILASLGVDYLVELDFDRDFSTKTPEEFLKSYILHFQGVREFFIGHDFAFGVNKQGGFDFIKKTCASIGINVEIQSEFELKNEKISSSIIREKLKNGQIEMANQLLARPYFLEGRVVKGAGRGKQIGFPTANLDLNQEITVPQLGVYITQTIYKGMKFNSITNVGMNPTFSDVNKINVETNLFDFTDDIYGENIRVNFLKKLRPEKKFESVNKLIDQIRIDVETAKRYFNE